MDKFVGKRLDGRYEIQEVIGVGGMAVVYEAYDNIEDRIVAVKILKEEFEANYKNFSHDSIENTQKKHKKTLLSDVLFFYPNSYCTGDILALAYWKNIYKDKEFIVILYKNGTIATRLIDN